MLHERTKRVDVFDMTRRLEGKVAIVTDILVNNAGTTRAKPI